MKVPIGVSNHHVHLTKEDFIRLFGCDATLEKYKDLKQPGQFASLQTVSIKTENGGISNLRVLGPFRNYTQVELSQTDCRKLKINAPVRKSGDLEGAASVTIVGPNGSICRSVAILADRHIHITSYERKKFNLSHVDEVSVKIDGCKGGIYHHVKIREAPNSCFEMHLDTDDANAFLVDNDTEGEIILL